MVSFTSCLKTYFVHAHRGYTRVLQVPTIYALGGSGTLSSRYLGGSGIESWSRMLIYGPELSEEAKGL